MTFQPKFPKSSTSTPDRTSRMAVQRKTTEALSAYRLLEDQAVSLPDGTLAPGQAGGWVVFRGQQALQYLPDALFQKTFEPVEEGLLLRPKTRGELEKRLGVGATQSPEALFKAIERLARIQVGEITLTFTTGQLEELAHRAAKQRLTLAEYLGRLLERFTEDLWKISAA